MYIRLVSLWFVFCVCLVFAKSSIKTTHYIIQSTAKMTVNESTPATHPMKPVEKSLWLHRPEAMVSAAQNIVARSNEPPHLPPQDVESFTNIARRHPLPVTKLTRPLGFGVAPYFPKIYFESFEPRKKPVVILALKKQGIPPIKVTLSSRSPGVAVLQSPYNNLNEQVEELYEDSLNAEVEKIW